MTTATLYLPGEPPLVLAPGALPPKPLALFFRKANGQPDPERLAVADWHGVAEALSVGPEQIEQVYGSTTRLVFGRFNATEYAECAPNPAAEQALLLATGESLPLVGPILILAGQ